MKDDKVREVSRVSEVTKMAKQGRPAWQTKSALTHLETAKGGQVHTYTQETAKEMRSTIIHDKTRHEAAEPASCKSLVP